mgnify:CR=1 FL=1
MQDLVISNCRVLRFGADGSPRIDEGRDILIEQGRIAGIVESGSRDSGTQHGGATTRGAPAPWRLDARGRLALPGLINTHAHVPMVLFRGLGEDVAMETWFNDYVWPMESNLTEEDVYWGMLLGLIEMIEAGVTTVADHYFFMDHAAEAVKRAGTRAALGWAIFGDGGEAGLQRAAEFTRRWQGGAEGRISTWMAPHAPYTCDDDFLRATAEAAGELGVGIHIHAAETMAQTNASLEKRRITPIQVLEKTGILERPTIIAHGCGLLPDDIAILRDAPAPVGVTHAPKTYLKLGMGLTPIDDLRHAGIPVGLATDGAVSNNTLDILESLRLMAMLQKHETRQPQAMPIPQALDIAFHGSAALIGMQDQLGRLEEGFRGDVILVDTEGSHHQPLHSVTASLVYNTRPEDVRSVVVDGQVIMEERKLLTIDREEVFREVRRSMERLSRRVPGQRIQTYNP